jgi:hypothetical protein
MDEFEKVHQVNFMFHTWQILVTKAELANLINSALVNIIDSHQKYDYHDEYIFVIAIPHFEFREAIHREKHQLMLQ